jgi:hypothetical protein
MRARRIDAGRTTCSMCIRGNCHAKRQHFSSENRSGKNLSVGAVRDALVSRGQAAKRGLLPRRPKRAGWTRLATYTELWLVGSITPCYRRLDLGGPRLRMEVMFRASDMPARLLGCWSLGRFDESAGSAGRSFGLRDAYRSILRKVFVARRDTPQALESSREH